MSDRMCAEIFIGGPVPRRFVASFCKAISDAGVGLNWGDAIFAPTTGADLVDACRDEAGAQLLCLCNVEAAWGEFPELENFLVKQKIAFRRRSDAKYEHDYQLVEYRPDVGVVRYRTDSSGKPLVPLADLVQIDASVQQSVESAAGKSAAQVLTLLRGIRQSVKKSLPPLVPPLESLLIVGKARKRKPLVKQARNARRARR